MNIDTIMNPHRPTLREVNPALAFAIAVTEAIRMAGRIPSGHLYAMLAGKVDFQGYQALICTLVNAGLVKEVAHELIWTGPALEGGR